MSVAGVLGATFALGSLVAHAAWPPAGAARRIPPAPRIVAAPRLQLPDGGADGDAAPWQPPDDAAAAGGADAAPWPPTDAAAADPAAGGDALDWLPPPPADVAAADPAAPWPPPPLDAVAGDDDDDALLAAASDAVGAAFGFDDDEERFGAEASGLQAGGGWGELQADASAGGLGAADPWGQPSAAWLSPATAAPPEPPRPLRPIETTKVGIIDTPYQRRNGYHVEVTVQHPDVSPTKHRLWVSHEARARNSPPARNSTTVPPHAPRPPAGDHRVRGGVRPRGARDRGGGVRRGRDRLPQKQGRRPRRPRLGARCAPPPDAPQTSGRHRRYVARL